MSGALLIACSPGELWAALVAEDDLAALRVLRDGAGARAGDLFLGRVAALKPELPAALVDIGAERPGFLSAEDAASLAAFAALHEGQAVTVQILKEARADKAAGLSMRPRLAGRLIELMPARDGIDAQKGLDEEERQRLAGLLGTIARPGEGFLLRRAAAGASAEALTEEAEALRARWRRIEAESRRAGAAPRPLEESASPIVLALEEFAPASPEAVVIDDGGAYAEARRWLARHRPALVERASLYRGTVPLFEEHGIAGDIAAVLAPRVPLAGGGRLIIEETAAATMIDVDMGGAGGRGRDAARAILAANLAAAKEVARQIRLRGLAGPIVVGFIGMRREQREQVREALAAALAGEAELLGWTRLGHLELVRKRRQAPLAELLFERTPEGGRVKTPLTVALEALRAMARAAATAVPRAPVLHLHPEVAAALDGPGRTARQELERRLGRPIGIVGEPGRARETFDLRLG